MYGVSVYALGGWFLAGATCLTAARHAFQGSRGKNTSHWQYGVRISEQRIQRPFARSENPRAPVLLTPVVERYLARENCPLIKVARTGIGRDKY